MEGLLELLGVLAIIVGFMACCVFPYSFDEQCQETYGQSVLSIGWAAAGGFGILASVLNPDKPLEEKCVAILITIVIHVIACRRCKKKLLALGASRGAIWLGMLCQVLASIGMIGLFFLACLLFGGKDNKQDKEGKK